MSRIPDTRLSLVMRLRDPHDDQAWSEFLAIYEPLVQRLARRKGLQDADARELAQEVFLAVSRAIERWDPDSSRGSFRGWLFQIARNLIINSLKRQGRHPRATGDSDFQRMLEQQPDPVNGDSALFEFEYRRQLFLWAADRIRDDMLPETWAAFEETCLHGRAIDEVASELGLSRGSVYVARSRVMQRLRRQIERMDETETGR